MALRHTRARSLARTHAHTRTRTRTPLWLTCRFLEVPLSAHTHSCVRVRGPVSAFARAGACVRARVRALVQVCTELRALYPESLPIIMVRAAPGRLGPPTRIADSDCRLGLPTRIASAGLEASLSAEKESAALTPESEPAEQTRFTAVSARVCVCVVFVCLFVCVCVSFCGVCVAGVGQHGRGEHPAGLPGRLQRLRQEALQPRRGPRQVHNSLIITFYDNYWHSDSVKELFRSAASSPGHAHQQAVP